MRTVLLIATGWTACSVPLAVIGGQMLNKVTALADEHESVGYRFSRRAA